MFGEDTAVQAQRDAIITISSGNRLRDFAGITLLWVLVFALGFSCGVVTWVGPNEMEIRKIVAAEVPGHVRAIILD